MIGAKSCVRWQFCSHLGQNLLAKLASHDETPKTRKKKRSLPESAGIGTIEKWVGFDEKSGMNNHQING